MLSAFSKRIFRSFQAFFLAFFAVSSILLLAPMSALAAEPSVTVSSESDAATATGYSFAIDDFSRAQVGSNRAINNTYYGYNYYSGANPSSLAMIAMNDYVVVYTMKGEAAGEYDPADPGQQAALKQMLIKLDTVNANGAKIVSEDQPWYFTQEDRFLVGGAAFEFNRELKAGQYFSSVVGQDGSDVTNLENPNYINLSHADFGSLVDANNVQLAVAATGWDAFTQFLGGIDYSPLLVTLKTTCVAIVFIFVLGLAAAYFSLRISPRAQDIFDAIFTIPMVLPPTVCGFILLLALGRNSPVGAWFYDIGFPLIFSWPATVIAAVVVAFPLMYRSARGAFEGLDQDMLDAARTLGWSNGKVFLRLMLPLSWSSVAAGTVLALARALGEFGATLFLAGNYLGITRTIPIAIYFEWMNGRTDVALFWTGVIIVFSLMVIIVINVFSRRTTKYRKAAKE